MKLTKNLLSLLLVLMSTMTILFAQDKGQEADLIQLSKDKWQWMADKNTDLLDNLFHSKSMFVHMSGGWDKKREMEIIKSGSIWYKQATIHNASVQITGNTAVLLNKIDLLAVVRGNEVTNPFVVTEVYVYENDRWQLIGLSFTRLLTQ